MRLSAGRKISVLFASLLFIMLAAGGVSSARPPASVVLPNPVLVLIGQEAYEANGKQFMRYNYYVDNLAAYPNEMFAASPELPPCGKNTKASRTWVDLYDQSGKRLYGFCALGSNADLGKLWFALEVDVVPPSWVYIEMTDRKTNTKYKSNLAETTN
jgi:hypothetical protein